MLAADGLRGESGLAALLQFGAVGLHRLRLVLGLELFVGLGAVSLRPLVLCASTGLVLVSGRYLVTGVGLLEIYTGLLRLGSSAAFSLLPAGIRFQLLWSIGRAEL